MTVLYFISYGLAVTAPILCLFNYMRKRKKPLSEIVYLKELDNVDIFSIFGSVSKSFKDKKAAIIVYLAQKGFIKLVKDSDGKIHILKLRDGDKSDNYIKGIMTALFAENVSYYGDENSIMPYESVAWEDVVKKYKKKIDDITRSTKYYNKKKIAPKLGRIREFARNYYFWIIWGFGLLPFCLTWSVVESEELGIAFFVIYFAELFNFYLGKLNLKVIKKLFNWDIVEGKRILAVLLWTLKTVGIMIAVLFMSVWVLMGIAYLAVCEEMPMFDMPMNMLLGFFLVVMTFILRSQKKKKEDNQDLFNENEAKVEYMLKKNALKKIVKNKDDYNKAMPFAYMYDKGDELKKLDIEGTDEQPDWFEGNWDGIEELMLELDK